MQFVYTKEIGEPFAYGYMKAIDKGLAAAMGEGMYEEGLVMALEYDREVGLFQCNKYPAAPIFSDSAVTYYNRRGINFRRDIFEKKKQAFPAYEPFFAAMEETFASLNTVENIVNSFTPYEKACQDTSLIWGGTYAGHYIPDYGTLLQIGTDGYREKIAKYRRVNAHGEDLYNGLDRLLDMYDCICDRIREEALAMAETEEEPFHKKRLQDIAKVLEICPRKPAYDFLSACQIFWIFFASEEFDSPGRIDQFLYPFWHKTPKEEALGLLEGLWHGFYKHRSWNVCISGSDENWMDTTNEISFAILDLVKKYHYSAPNLTMRCFEGTDPALIRSALEALAQGCGIPALYNDRVVCRMLTEKLGIPPKDAHNYAMNGCNQFDIQGKSHMGLEDGGVNLYKCVELTLTRGRCLLTDKHIGIDTGDPASFATFEDLMAACRKQIENAAEVACSTANKGQQYHGDKVPMLFGSLLIEGCIEKGKQCKAGGPVYNHGQMLIQGLADAADSLAAIRYHVYEKKNYTLSQIIAAMERDFAGEEVMRRQLSEKPARFGNGEETTDAIAEDIVDCYFRHLLTLRTWRGGIYSGGCSPFREAPYFGRAVGAGANGRHKEDPLIADSIGATPGRDENGPTALLRSVLHLPHHLAGSGFILNLKFDKSILNTPKGIESLQTLIHTYFVEGGQHVAVSAVCPEELRDAKIHPENHRNLLVRVGGYNDYFVDLKPDMQDNILARTSLEV